VVSSASLSPKARRSRQSSNLSTRRQRPVEPSCRCLVCSPSLRRPSAASVRWRELRRRFGFTNPVLIDGENSILAGHGRVEAARQLGMTAVPCLCVNHLPPAEKRAYVLADNKLALNAGWDEELLALELQELMDADIEFDVGIIGFSIAEVDQLVEGLAREEGGDPADDRLPDPNKVAARCRPGDIWRLGSHRLVCGDSLDPAVVSALMDGEKAKMVFTDPPYNVAIDGNVSGLGTIRHREFAMASGEMTRDEFTAFLSAAFANLPRWLDPLHLHGLATHGRDA
jgi:hypothetical protein